MYSNFQLMLKAANKGQARVYNNTGEKFVFAEIDLRDGVYYGARQGKEVRLDPA
jgi:hypothetical protein